MRIEQTRWTERHGREPAGFYSYGEISPFTPSATCELHNQTITITTLTES